MSNTFSFNESVNCITCPDDSGYQAVIVVCDDDPVIRSLAGKILKRLGYCVLLAENGTSALAVCTEYHTKIDLLILDIQLPDMSAPEIIASIRSFIPSLRILVCSGYDPDPELLNAMKSGLIAYLSKPYGLDKLGSAVKQLLDKK